MGSNLQDEATANDLQTSPFMGEVTTYVAFASNGVKITKAINKNKYLILPPKIINRQIHILRRRDFRFYR